MKLDALEAGAKESESCSYMAKETLIEVGEFVGRGN